MSSGTLLFGTKEWAPHNFNFINGCSNDCVYCYAKDMAIRFKRKDASNWKMEEAVDLAGRSFRKKNGSIMIPSSHDITSENLDTAVMVIEKLLEQGNELLVVTKPRLACIERITEAFGDYKTHLSFRFTVGSADSTVLKLWEPGASDFTERLASLQHACAAGFSTSISCEPLLDDYFDELYHAVRPWVTGSIWVGKMNMASKRVRTNTLGLFPQHVVDALLATQTDEKMLELYRKYRDNPIIAWKESIQKVITDVIHKVTGTS